MQIQGKREEYRVKWIAHGFTFAIPRIHAWRKCKGFLWWKWGWGWEQVSDDDKVPTNKRYHVERMLPHEMRAWFTKAVDQYEEYVIAWEREHEGECTRRPTNGITYEG